MRKGRLTVSLGTLVVVALCGSPLVSPTAATDGAAFPVVQLAPRSDPMAGQLLERLRRWGAPPTLLERLASAESLLEEEFGWAETVHDLDGDGNDDVVGMRHWVRFDISGPPLWSTSFEGSTTMTAFRGTDGKRLWTLDFDDLAFPAEALVGRQAKRGLHVYTTSGFGGGISEDRASIRALRGRDGKEVWRHEFRTTSSTTSQGWIFANTPVQVAQMNAFPGRQTDVLVGLADVAVMGVVRSAVSHALIVDGRSGEIIEHPRRVVGRNWIPTPWPAPDLDADRLHDYVWTTDTVLSTGSNQGAPVIFDDGLIAIRGSDGEEQWASGEPDLGDVAWIWGFNGLMGRGRPGLAVASTQGGYSDWTLYGVEGRDGDVRWTRKGGWPYSPGDLNGDGVRDLISFQPRMNDRALLLDAHAIGGRGKRLYSRTYTMRYPPGTCAGFCFLFAGWGFTEAGDLQPDGLQDWFGAMFVEREPGGSTFSQFTVDARNGRQVHTGGEELWPVRAAVRPRGADVARIERSATGMKVRAERGDRSTPIWETDLVLPFNPRRTNVWAAGGRLSGDRCAEVVVTTSAPNGSYVIVLDGHDGSLRWAHNLVGRTLPLAERTAVIDRSSCSS